MLAGALIRALTMVAYPPALLFPDSFGYIAAAFSGSLPSVHPFGYSILLWLLTLPGRSLAELVAFQHLAVLAAGLAIYVALIRSRLPRWAAAAAAALVLLDGYTVTLEQYVMSDTFFTVLVLAAALLAAWPRLGAARTGTRTPRSLPATEPMRERRLRRYVLAGLLLALAGLVREATPFVAPVFLVYLVWVRVGRRAILAFLLAALLPLVAYSALVDAHYHVFGMTATSGWTLYGRVGGFADCAGVRVQPAAKGLCETAAQRASHPDAPDWYIWGPSPAQRLFHPDTQSLAQVAPTNAVLESFARTMILAHPLAFTEATLSDFGRYFTPGATPYRNSVSATSLPARAGAEARDPATRRRYLPGLRPRVRPPSRFVRSYRRLVHVPRALLAALALVAVLAVIMRVPARREILLFAGSALLLLLGTAATAGFGLRYLLPAVPLLAIGGSLAAAQLLSRVREQGSLAGVNR